MFDVQDIPQTNNSPYFGDYPLYFLGTLIMESYKSFAKDKSDYLLPNRGEIISQDKPKSDRPKPVPHKSSHLEDTIIKCSRQFSPSRNNSSII